jgi:hypothetical protein
MQRYALPGSNRRGFSPALLLANKKGSLRPPFFVCMAERVG